MPDTLTAKQYACVLITHHEGFSTNPYRDPNGVVTIGYGTTYIDGVHILMDHGPITNEQGIALIGKQITDAFTDLSHMIPDHVQPYEAGAVLSLAYNVGTRAVASSSLMKYMQIGSLMRAAVEFPLFSHAGGQLINGLLRRRISEQYTFLTGEFMFQPGTEYKLMAP